MNQRPVPLSFLGRSSSTTVNAQALVATKDRGGPYWGYGASHTNRRLRVRRSDRHGHVPTSLTLLVYPVQSPCYKVPWDLIAPLPFIFPPPPSRHFDNLLLLLPCIVLLSNAIALYKHHLFRFSLLATRRGCPQLSPTKPNRPLKDAIGKSPQPLRDCWAPAGYRWTDTEGTTAQPG